MASLPFSLPSLTGKVYLVTGGNTGVGYHTVEELAKKGARVYIGARSPEKAESAITQIKSEYADADLHTLQIDLMDLQSVNSAAKQFKDRETELHGLINSAGIMATPFALSSDGHEAQWQTNYLSHWLLTWHLLDTLSATAREEISVPGTVRIVNVTSDGHQFAPKAGIDFTDLKQEKGGIWSRYGMSKLGNILHAKQLNKLYGPAGSEAESKGPIWIAAVHPGHLDTNLNRQTALPKCFNTVLKAVGAYSHAREGAYNSLFAVASMEFRESDSGGYFVPGQKRKTPSKAAMDMELARRLWEWTEREMRDRGFLE
ncbi:uncharacterized protein BDV14DRAFT_198902 [Aspergillus stella-maris]|uniref:uncharacterized protein n=1 Tax=Aspergillus stella-maris TaxID=1810926 RepID=UPI003CCD040C